MKYPLLGKSVAVGAVSLLLVAGLGLVTDIVHEREGRLREAERSVEQSLAGRQVLVGPVLHRRCAESREVEQGEGRERKLVTERREFVLSAVPQGLDIEAQVLAEPRYRGIFKVNAYALKATLAARWDTPVSLQPVARHAGSRLDCEAPVLFVAVGDARGIRASTVQVDGVTRTVMAGTTHPAHPRGLHVELPAAMAERGPQRVEVSLDLVGTSVLDWAPVADQTELMLRSDWPHPSFEGRFLPAQREVGDAGFQARWRLSALATTAPQELLAGAPVCADGGAEAAARRERCIETFGVSLVDPVGPYRLSDRATKYGLLFIVLTFVGVGLVEVLRSLRVHPVQYMLVGSALVVFFLLLVSLTEHLPFAAAYAIAAGACTLLLGFYGRFVLQGTRAGLGFGAAVGVLYGALYLLLQLEQSALLLGSLLLFLVLAAVMVATRRIDWYALMASLRQGAEPLAPPRG